MQPFAGCFETEIAGAFEQHVGAVDLIPADPRAEVEATKEEHREGIAKAQAEIVDPHLHLVGDARALERRPAIRNSVEHQEPRAGVSAQVVEALAREGRSLVDALAQLVARSVWVRVALAPEGLDERIALVVFLECHKRRPLSIRDQGVDRLQPALETFGKVARNRPQAGACPGNASHQQEGDDGGAERRPARPGRGHTR